MSEQGEVLDGPAGVGHMDVRWLQPLNLYSKQEESGKVTAKGLLLPGSAFLLRGYTVRSDIFLAVTMRTPSTTP